NQRGPKIYAREVDAIYLQISEEWFGYQAETLSSSRKSSDHCECRNKDVNPAVVKRERDGRLAYFSSSHKNEQKSRKRVLLSCRKRTVPTDQNPAQTKRQTHEETDPSC